MEHLSELTTYSTGAKTPSASGTSKKSRRTGSKTQSKDTRAPGNTTMRIAFRVCGNGDGHAAGNPMSKIRLTGRQQWMPKAQRYAAWKSHVVASLIDAYRGKPEYPAIVRGLGLEGKPFTTKKEWKAQMKVIIHWYDNTHGDPEGVFGSIADALFKQDKYLAGVFEFDYAEDKRGSVDIEITLDD